MVRAHMAQPGTTTQREEGAGRVAQYSSRNTLEKISKVLVEWSVLKGTRMTSAKMPMSTTLRASLGPTIIPHHHTRHSNCPQIKALLPHKKKGPLCLLQSKVLGKKQGVS
jgi:hypothetical protein